MEFNYACEFCRQIPHHPRCPEANEPKTVGDCEICGYEIYMSHKYVEINGRLYCWDCIRECIVYPEIV